MVVGSIGHLLFQSTSGGENGAGLPLCDGALEITKLTSRIARRPGLSITWPGRRRLTASVASPSDCLLYTSDAADDTPC
eukprot:5850149-Pyramimonas_sp.AAC.1